MYTNILSNNTICTCHMYIVPRAPAPVYRIPCQHCVLCRLVGHQPVCRQVSGVYEYVWCITVMNRADVYICIYVCLHVMHLCKVTWALYIYTHIHSRTSLYPS